MARTTTHFVWTDDYADRLAVLRAQIEALSDRDSETAFLAEGSERSKLVEQYDELKEEAQEKGIRMVLRGLSDDEWDELVEKHPPRTDEANLENDKELGFNERTGMRALIYAALVEPSFDSRAKFDAWVTEKGFTRGDLIVAALKAGNLTNGVGPMDPKLLPPLPVQSAEPSSELP